MAVGVRQSIFQGWCGFVSNITRMQLERNLRVIFLSVVLHSFSNRRASFPLHDPPAIQSPLPVLDTHRNCQKFGSFRVDIQYAAASPGPSRQQPLLPGQKLRRRLDNMGQDFRHFRRGTREGANNLRPCREPAVFQSPTLTGTAKCFMYYGMFGNFEL